MQIPHNNDGPFVQNSRGPGLLRRLLGGGANDPTAPHTHLDPSTTRMHQQPLRRTAHPTPVAPRSSPFGIPRVGAPTGFPSSLPSSPSTQLPDGSPERGKVVATILWLVRHPRIAITLGALLLVFIGQWSDSPSPEELRSQELQQLQDDAADGTYDVDVDVPDFVAPAPTDPGADPASAMGSGTEVGLITQVEGQNVTIAKGTMAFTWKVASPELAAVLRQNLDQDAVVFWERRRGETWVTGVTGPGGTFAPPAPAQPVS
ncbi:MAG: hypothetical protein JWL76_453 [Thermoleophilia bacterium]|nr:hypothetical protein [Thermoleophilia bacterium]